MAKETIIKGQFKNNGEYKKEDKYTPILNNGIVIGFIESVEKEKVNVVLWSGYISKNYLTNTNTLHSMSLDYVI